MKSPHPRPAKKRHADEDIAEAYVKHWRQGKPLPRHLLDEAHDQAPVAQGPINPKYLELTAENRAPWELRHIQQVYERIQNSRGVVYEDPVTGFIGTTPIDRETMREFQRRQYDSSM